MSNARNIADLLDSAGDVKASALDNTLNGLTIAVVAEVPSSPVANTIYLVEE